MAQITAYSAAGTNRIVATGTSVYVLDMVDLTGLPDAVSSMWASDGNPMANWTWVPWLYPERATLCLSPSVPTATFVWRYGVNRQPEMPWRQYDPPINLLGKLVCIYANTVYGGYPIWLGQFEVEDQDMEGTVGYASGKQTFTAYGLEHLWDRVQIRGAYTEGGYIERGMEFNRRVRYGNQWQGNRTLEVGEDGVFLFGKDNQIWTNLQILQHLIQFYSPFPVNITGAYAALDNIIGNHQFDGISLKSAVDHLVDRHRGLSCRIVPNMRRVDQLVTPVWDDMNYAPMAFDGTFSLEIVSSLAYPFSFGEYQIPANPNQSIMFFDGDLWTNPKVTYNDAMQFDSIRAQGGNCRVCCTFSVADGDIEPDWTPELETAYKQVGTNSGVERDPVVSAEDRDKERQTIKFKDVYQTFRVPLDWDFKANNGELTGQWNYAAKACRDDAVLIDPPNEYGCWVGGGLEFERSLPIVSTVPSVDGIETNMQPFVLVKDSGGKWQFVDRLTNADDPGDASVRLIDNRLALQVDSTDVGHRFALGHWEPTAAESAIQPKYAYSTFLATMFFQIDTRLAATVRRYGVPYGAKSRELVISVPDCETWLILPGTVTDVTDGKLVRTTELLAARDDGAKLRGIAAFAGAYYNQAISTLEATIRFITTAHQPGSLILGASNIQNYSDWGNNRLDRDGNPLTLPGAYFKPIGTVVSSVTLDFVAQTTTVTTNFAEIERG